MTERDEIERDDAEPDEAIEAVEARPNRWLPVLAVAPLVAVPLLWVAALALSEPMFAVGTLHLFLIGIIASLFVRRRNPWPKAVPVALRVDDGALMITERERGAVSRISRTEITAALKAPTEQGLHVRLRRKRKREVHLAVADDAAADTLLRRLGHDVDQTVASFSGMSRTYASMPRVFATIFTMVIGSGMLSGLASAVGPSIVPFASISVVFAIAAMIIALFWPARTEVGADGIAMHWLGRSRFIPHAEIRDVCTDELGYGRSRRRVVVRLTLHSGEKVIIPIGAPSWEGGKADMLATRIEDAARAAERGSASPSALLRREKRAFTEWVQALRARDATDLRSPAVSRDRLWRVIEDAAASAVERAAAMVALGPEIPREERERLARISKVVAAPKLRVALEAGPDAEVPKLAGLLEDLEQEEMRDEKKRRKRAKRDRR